jgi:hypothetical protein
MPNVVFVAGQDEQLNGLLGSFGALLPHFLFLAADTVPFTGSESWPPSPIVVIGGDTLFAELTSSNWLVNSDSTGATATMDGAALISAGTGSGTVTLSQWFIGLTPTGPALWGGSVSPSWTPGPGGGSLQFSGITITLGQCSTPSPPSPAVWFPGGLADWDFSALVQSDLTPVASIPDSDGSNTGTATSTAPTYHKNQVNGRPGVTAGSGIYYNLASTVSLLGPCTLYWIGTTGGVTEQNWVLGSATTNSTLVEDVGGGNIYFEPDTGSVDVAVTLSLGPRWFYCRREASGDVYYASSATPAEVLMGNVTFGFNVNELLGRSSQSQYSDPDLLTCEIKVYDSDIGAGGVSVNLAQILSSKYGF